VYIAIALHFPKSSLALFAVLGGSATRAVAVVPSAAVAAVGKFLVAAGDELRGNIDGKFAVHTDHAVRIQVLVSSIGQTAGSYSIQMDRILEQYRNSSVFDSTLFAADLGVQ